MKLTVQAATSASEDSSADNTLVIDKPAGTVEGDLLVAVLSKNGSGNAYPDQTGWTTVARQTNATAPAGTSFMIYKVAGASEPAQYTFSAVGTTPTLQGGIVCYAGPLPATPLDASASTNDADASDTSVDAPTVTVSASDGATVTRVFVDTTQTWTASDSALQVRARFTIAGTVNPRVIAFYDEDKAASGATGTQTATTAAASSHSAYTAAYLGVLVVPAAPTGLAASVVTSGD